MKDRKALAREIAARTIPRLVEIERERKKRGFTNQEMHRPEIRTPMGRA
jgi:hypothetical protein